MPQYECSTPIQFVLEFNLGFDFCKPVISCLHVLQAEAPVKGGSCLKEGGVFSVCEVFWVREIFWVCEIFGVCT